MIFPLAILSDLIDSAETKSGISLSGSYSGAFIMIGCFATGTTILIISFFFEIFGPTSPISYGIILSGMGTILIIIATILFHKVQITGTKQKD